ncbi:MAG: tetratricopeptide repeat protein, partial [Dolichospermum sp.]
MNYRSKNIIKIIVVVFSIVCLSNCIIAQTTNKKAIDSLLSKASELKYDSPDSAIIIYNKLIDYYKQKSNLDDLYVTQIKLASCLSIQQKNNEALKVYEACLKYYQQKNDSVNLSSVYSGMAGVCYNLNDSKRVIAYLEMASKVCNVNSQPKLKFINILNLENYYVLTEQYDSAYKCCQQASKLLSIIKDSVATYQLKIKLTYIYYVKHQYKQAIENGLAVLNFSNNSDKRVSMSAYSIVGSSYFALKDYQKSRVYLDSALDVSKRINSLRDYREILQSKFMLDTATKN